MTEFEKYNGKIEEICRKYGYKNCEKCPLYSGCNLTRNIKQGETSAEYTERCEKLIIETYKKYELQQKNRIPVNNGLYKRIEPGTDCVHIYTENENGENQRTEIISGGDFVSLLNWYRYQKENGNEQLLF